MLFLTSASTPETRAAWADGRLGCLLLPDHGKRLKQLEPVSVWAADNGCYAKGERFDMGIYLDWLAALTPHRARCLFATAPDVVGDAAATWARSAPTLPQIRALGYRAALVAQDGLDPATLAWDDFDALFVGGTTGYKLSAGAFALVREAKARGKWTHMGRCNSLRRLRSAVLGGYDSADGTQLAYRPSETVPKLLGWMRYLREQQRLPLGGTEVA